MAASPGTRRIAAGVLIALGTVLLLATAVTGYARDTLTDSDEFADRTQRAFSDPAVRQSVTDQVVQQLVEAEPELLAVQPLLQSVVSGVLASEIAIDIVGAATADLHRTLFTNATDTVTLELADLILVAKTQLTVLDPELGALIPDDLTDALVEAHTSELMVDATQLVESLDALSLWLPLISVLAFSAALWLSARPRRTMILIGILMVGVGTVLVIGEQLLRAVVTRSSDEPDVARAVWDAYLGDLDAWALVLVALGALLASIAWFGVGQGDTAARIERLGHLVRRRSTVGGRIIWGAAAVALGVFVIGSWATAVQLLVASAGVVLVVIGAREILLAVFPGLEDAVEVPDDDHAEVDSRRQIRVLGTVGLLIGGVVVAIVLSQSDGEATATSTDAGCNGSVVLCTRPLDQIVLAATHNSNAAANDGFTFGYQTVGIGPQLEDGIRGLLIDVYWGLDTGDDIVVTDRAPVTSAERAQLVDEVGEAAVAAAETTVARTAELGGTRGLYLCHAFCEIGARPLGGELRAIADFMADHPRDVIVMIIQDEGPGPADIAAAFDETGLDELVYTHTPGPGWPTLEEMIEADTRLVVMAENRSGEIDWYHNAWELTQDTPFKYESVEVFDCAENRGTPDSPLLLVNHWLNPVSPSAADQANTDEVILARYEQCREDRNRMPNLIAVDFHDRGDLIAVVDRLNGL